MKAKQIGATVTFIEDAALLESTAVSPRSCDGADKLAIGLLFNYHAQNQ